MIKIEPYQSADRPLITKFVEAIQEHERLAVPELKVGSEMGDIYVEMLLQNVNEKNGIILIARADGQAVGFICAYLDEDDDLALKDEFRPYAYVSDIYVAPEWQRQGIANQLLKEVENKMYAHNCKQIRIYAKATNTMALNFYEKTGYKQYEIIFSKQLG